jgi:hypothetical protein
VFVFFFKANVANNQDGNSTANIARAFSPRQEERQRARRAPYRFKPIIKFCFVVFGFDSIVDSSPNKVWG